MSWTRLASTFRSGILDRETTLAVVDLLSGVEDPKLEEELFAFIFAWEESEASSKKTLLDELQQINTDYLRERSASEAREKTAVLTIAKDIDREQRISAIRKTIQSL